MKTRLLVVGAVIVAGCAGPESFHERVGAGASAGTGGTIAVMVPGTAGADGTAGAGEPGSAGAVGGAGVVGTAGAVGGPAGIVGGSAGAGTAGAGVAGAGVAGAGSAGATVDAGAPGTAGATMTNPHDAAVEAPPAKAYGTAQWKATASITAAGNADLPANVFDGNITTRWTTGRAQTGGETLTIDMGVSQSVGRVVIDDTSFPTDFPATYALEVSTNNTSFTSVKTGTGAAVIDVSFAPAMARYVRVRQTGTTPVAWLSIGELRIYP